MRNLITFSYVALNLLSLEHVVTAKPVVDSKQAMHAPFIASAYCTECSRSLPDYTGAVYAR